MALVQYIYTSILETKLSAQRAYDTSAMSVNLCQQFGITGRVFANRQQTLAITEGPEESVARYFQAVSQDPMNETIVPHVQRAVERREFEDYSVWLNLGSGFEYSEHVRELTPQSLQAAWPDTLSPKMRIMANAYLDPALAVAATA